MALDTDLALTNIWSYGGHERQISDYLVDRLGRAGLDAHRQDLDERSANTIVALGEVTGTQLMLVAPTDSHFAGNQAEDGLQWGEPNRRDNMLPATRVGESVVGLASDNPKAMVTAITLALEALNAVGFRPRGGLVGAFAACGAPARAPESEPRKLNSLGAGVWHMASQGVLPDFAMYHKPGYQIAWEDMALNQFEITIAGDPTYMAYGGMYRVMDAVCQVASKFNAWTRRYAQRKHGTFEGLSALNVIQVGRAERPNWSSGVAKLYADIRTAPLAPPAFGRQVMERVMAEAVGNLPEVEISWRQVAFMPGGSTSPLNWIVQSGIRGSLSVDGRREEMYTSAPVGQTEMGYLQRLGVATAKLHGFPPGVAGHPEMPADIKELTLSCAYAPHIVKAARVMIYAAVDTLSRSADELLSVESSTGAV
ncbi:hypothetical protein WL88_25825 [Burkholderia diffusa]|uniref:Uncharacterized protein n=2 Tax=Burkholderia diffusa TaxID=488732 RepID=A0AAW3PAV5_9BURK|nr:hypothetical protein WL86_29865 [Burkholderia diffusa]KWF38688.1 hypothetical protein WL85_11010 [Burkholderia diffusa]KWF46733.1 hypothetical protein WL88_25825 [Burkholderia diffusa]KWF50696.1 hypothetical protein WL87_16095 [Burkholderia diffusa]